MMSGPRFPMGQMVMTSGVKDTLAQNDDVPFLYLRRHEHGDWGDLDKDDLHANEDALRHGSRLLSAYHLKDGTKIWIITEADRSVTTVLLPEEY